MTRLFVKTLLIFLFASSVANAQPGIISTVAGTGTASFGGDGGPATAAMINHPIGISIDMFGNVFFAERYNHRIRKINTAGVISTVAGTGTAGFSGDGGPATAAKINQPYWVDVDAAGNLYIADAFNQRIRKVSASGIISTIAGTGVGAYGGDGGAATAAQIWIPTSVKHDNAGNLYIADNQNYRIRKVTPAGIITTLAGNGVPTYSGDGAPATAASLRNPSSTCIDAAGNVLIADSENGRIRKVTPAGIISTIAGTGVNAYGGDGGAATVANVNRPQDVICDAAGNVYIADNINSRVRKIDLSGTITTIVATGVAGFGGDGGPATAAKLNKVNGIFFDPWGNLFIADVFNHRIRKVGSSTTNYPPNFTKGASQNLFLCITESSAPSPIDSFLPVLDLDMSQTLTWGIATAPAHGVLSGSYTATSTGGTITPSGYTYAATSGYTGPDMFKICVNDGTAYDTITINVTIDASPVAGVISGLDSVCPSGTATLSETVSGGVWSSGSTAIATINSSGMVTGVAPGTCIITYTVTNSCGTVVATRPFKVRAYIDCPLHGTNITNIKPIKLYPNPNNGRFIVNYYSGTDKEIDMAIFDLYGRKITEYKILANTPIELSFDRPAGIYLLQSSTNTEVWTERLIINR